MRLLRFTNVQGPLLSAPLRDRSVMILNMFKSEVDLVSPLQVKDFSRFVWRCDF